MGVIVREKIKGSGIYYLYIHHNGQRKNKRFGRDKKEAEKAAKLLEAKLALSEFNLNDREPVLFQNYAEVWMESIHSSRSTSTSERYRDILRQHILPEIGTLPLTKIARVDIRRVLQSIQKKGLSYSSVRLTRDVLSGVLGCAVDDELIDSNPVAHVLKRMGMEKKKKTLPKTLTPQEVKIFLQACQENYPEHTTLFLCAFRTGLRMGELLALQWGDIDWNRNIIQVERSFRRGRVGRTKTSRSRQVDMSDQLRQALLHLLTLRKREGLQAGLGEEVPWIFHRNGQPMPQNSLRNIFKRILKKAGMSQMRFHEIRHTFASLLLTNGETPVYVKEQMGHTSIQITVDIYGHLIPSSNRQAVNRLDDETAHPDAPETHPEKKQSP